MFMRLFALTLTLLSHVSLAATCDKMERRESGGILVFLEGVNELRIYDGNYKKTLTDKDILWSLNIRDIKNRSFQQSFSKSKNDAKPVVWRGELHLLLVSSRGDAVALVHFDSKRLAYFKKFPGSVHSAAVTPNGSIVLADSKGYARILSTETGNTHECRHSSPHAAVWDKELEVVWVWGGGRTVKGYQVFGDSRNPRLDCRGSIDYPINLEGGHDLQPFGESYDLIGTASNKVFSFDPMNNDWEVIASDRRGLKGVSRNTDTGEVIYIQNDRSNNFKFRSNIIRSTSRGDRVLPGKVAAYKIRWFQKNCFSW